MALRQATAIIAITFLSMLAQAQPISSSDIGKGTEKYSKPYRIHTSGKQITIKSTKEIQSVIVWTSDGHRIIEHRDVNTASYSFRITVKEKIFFIRLQFVDGKTFSEKIGVE